jgi:N-acetylglucosaminyldiphosphoundecaprenol N-acetyl-beta-D-mannosaminyltransferase
MHRPQTSVNPPHKPDRVTLGGVTFDRLHEAEVVRTVVDRSLAGEGGVVCPVNVDVMRQHAESPEVQAIVAEADIVVADGAPIVWASNLAGKPLPERVAGSSLITTVPPYAAECGATLFFIGGNQGAAEQAAAALRALNPGLRIAGTLCPPFGFEHDQAALAAIEQAIDAARPHVVFVGLGFPKQERLIRRLRTVHPSAWYVSCGVAFSFVSGEITRAPRAMQLLGLEWLHRLIQEPHRLYRRYLIDGPPFLLGLFATALKGRRDRSLTDG